MKTTQLKNQLETLEASQQASSGSEGSQSSTDNKTLEEAPVNTNTTSNASAPVDSLPDFDDGFDEDTIPF